MAFTLSGDVATTRTNLGLGDAATKTTGTASGNIPVLDSSGDLAASTYTNTDTVYTHPTTAGNKHIPTAGAANQVLTYSASGTATWADAAGGGKCVGFKLHDIGTSTLQTSSTSWTQVAAISYTPQSTNSIIVMTFHGNSATDQGSQDAQMGVRWNYDSTVHGTNLIRERIYGHYTGMTVNWTLLGDIGDTAYLANTASTARTFRLFFARRGGAVRDVFLHRNENTTHNSYITIHEYEQNT